MKRLDEMPLPGVNQKRVAVEEMANKLTGLILKSIQEIEKENSYKFSEAEKIAIYTALINRQSQNLLNKEFGESMLP